jgi:predicted permease/acylphosphatase
MTINRWHLLVSGKVQGVYYRASTEQKARELGLTGWVRNLPDGRVEIVAEGEPLQLKALHEWCHEGPERAVVDEVAAQELPATQEFTDFWATKRVRQEDRGVYVQGAFRGNCGIVGLALAANLYGDYGLSAGGLLLGLVIVVYNSLSVIVLLAYQPGKTMSLSNTLRDIARNPLIIGVVLAIPFAAFEITLPGWVMTSGDYFASLTLPLALLCIGATVSLKSIRSDSGPAMGSSIWKMVSLPALCTLVAWLAGFEGRELGLMFLFFASPTAAASFVMVKALGGNDRMAANIIALTTLLASVTVTTGVFVLQSIGVA